MPAEPASAQGLTELVHGFLAGVPSHNWPVQLAVGVLAAGVIVVRAYVQKKDLKRRGVLLEECHRKLVRLGGDLRDALDKPDPRGALSQLSATVREVVTTSYNDSVWPWPREPDGSGPAVSARIDELLRQHEAQWSFDPELDREEKE